MRSRLLALCVLVGAVGCGDDSAALCEEAELERMLAAAEPGDSIALGACRFEGSFVVPDGVSLQGAGRDRTVIAVGTGTGLELEGAATVADLSVVGPVTATTASTLPPLPDAAATAVIGIHAGGTGAVVLRDVDVSGFASFGARFDAANVTWTGGSASDNLGTGILVSGGSAELTDLEVCGTLRGVRLVSYGIVVANGAMVRTSGVEVCDGEAFGILHHDATGIHADLTVTGNAEPGVWVQGGSTLDITGAGSLLSGNALAGLFAVGTPNVRIDGARIEATTLAVRVAKGGTGTIMVGDGAQLVLDEGAMVEVRNTTFAESERVGLLVDVVGSGLPAGVTFDSVTVSSAGEAHGAVLQNPSGPIAGGEWDVGITRMGAASSLDATVRERFDVLGAVAPMF